MTQKPMLGDLRHFGDLLRRNARLFADAEGLADAEGAYTWRQGYGRALRLADRLRQIGLRPGERVLLLGNSSVAWSEALFALAGAGLVAVPVNTRLTAEEIAGIGRDCEARGLLVSDELLERGRDAAGQVPTLRFVGGLGKGSGEVAGYDRLLAEGAEDEAAFAGPIAPEDLLLLLYTSGTTGFPKGVMYSHGSALQATLVHVLAIASAHRHRVMLPSPPYSAAGFAGLACAVAVGSPTFLLRFSLDGALETLASQRITFTNLVPTTVRMLLDHPRFGDYDLSALEVLLYGGSPMREATLRDADRALGCAFRQTFATSETGLSGTVLEPEDHRRALDDPDAGHLLLSCGRPQVGVGVRLLSNDGVEVPDGEVGEVAVACTGNMVGYWNRPEATAAVLQDGWLRTGDLARRDEHGYFYLVDRKHDMIVTGALNVYPTEIERTLSRHPAVADCAVIGVPDEKWGEAVKALVVPRPGENLSADLLITWAREHLAGFKRPKSVEFVDQIPYNPAGKPLRRLLREPYWRGRERKLG
ncbi:MAG: AMP-binding protein [Acidobacteriota bacterium]